MDDKKKFEIEFDDDFDAWLAKHDEEKAKNEPPMPVIKPAAPSVPQTKEEPPKVVSSGGVFAPTDPASDIPVSRRDTVKNFKLNIDESILDEPVVNEPEKPKNKAVYFAARQPSKAQIEHRRAQEEARQERQKQEKQLRAKQRQKESVQVVRLRRALVCIVVVLVSVLASTYCISCINDILALSRDDELVTITIEKDSDYKEIIDVLGDNGLIKHEWFCKLMTKFRGFDDETYINGIHYLTADMGVEGMLTAMQEDRTSGETIRLSFPEGWTIPQIIEKLAANDVCPAEYLYDALAEVEFDYGFVSDVPNDGSRAYYLEGYLFPDTYDFFVSDKTGGIGENPNSVIRKFLANFETKWSEVYEKRAQELGYTMDEIIIIASIIQKEAADQSQMADVSSVIHNRLNNRSSYPTLGCDSTKNYVNTYLSEELGAAKANTYLSGYDTNSTRSGLPAGPICNPGVAAIEAALNPSDTNYFYFCHNEKGKIYLASTYSQFQANWAQVLKDNEG